MWLVVGLGNPERRYEGTRHNIGFDVVDCLGQRHGIELTGTFRHSVYGRGRLAGKTVALLKPTTYMNRSGFAISEALNWWKASHDELLIIVDDVSLPLGSLRIRTQGSPGGHNGLASVVEQLGTNQFARMRLGVGAPGMRQQDLADFVLSRFRREEQLEVDRLIEYAADAAEACVQDSVEHSISRYNRRAEPPPEQA